MGDSRGELNPVSPPNKNTIITIDMRALMGINEQTATEVDLGRVVCPPYSELSQHQTMRSVNVLQSFLRQDLILPEFDESEQEKAVMEWLDYSISYENKLFEIIKKRISVENLDIHVKKIKGIISNFIFSQSHISEDIRLQMAADVNSTRLLTTKRIKSEHAGSTREYLTLAYMNVCGVNHSKVNAFYTSVFERFKKNSLDEVNNEAENTEEKFIGHFMIICPQYLLLKYQEGHNDSELVATIGHEIGHIIDPRKHTTFHHKTNEQVVVDYTSVYGDMHKCIADHYHDRFLSLESKVAALKRKGVGGKSLKNLKDRIFQLKQHLGRDLQSHDSYMGELASDFWGILTVSAYLSEFDDPLDQISHLRGNMRLFCGPDRELGDGVHPPLSYRIEQLTQYMPIKKIVTKANSWTIIDKPFCGL